MKRLRRKANIAGIGGLLVGAGIMLGALASSVTTDALVWTPPPQMPVTDAAPATPVDQASAGKGWARTAFDGGLRQCPKMNAEFLAACQAEMKKLAARPDFPAGSYGGPLLITKLEPVPPANAGPDDEAWAAQDRLETPPPAVLEADYRPPPLPVPDEPSFERTPENYPAGPEPAIMTADRTAPSTGR
jgi:hypothetical protein